MLHDRGLTDSTVLSELARAARFSPGVDSVSVYSRGITVHARGVSDYSFELWGWGPWGTSNEREQVNRYMESIVRNLQPGVMVRVSTRVGRTSMRWYEEIGHAIEKLQAGKELSPADSVWLRSVDSNISRWDDIAHPLPLERVP
jgi:hypothetical protein